MPASKGESSQPQRHHPSHPPPIISLNQPTILFVTLCVKKKRPLLASNMAHECLLKAWTTANAWHVGRYVIMPNHVHFFCAPGTLDCTFKKWMEYWRYCFTRSWPCESDKPIWQRDYWDTQLRRGENYSEKWEYVRRNPNRAGLVNHTDDWPFAGEMHVLRW